MTTKNKNIKHLDNMDFDTVDIIMQAIYSDEKFKFITDKYIKIFRNKNNMSNDDILASYENFLHATISEKFKDNRDESAIKNIRLAQTNNSWKLKKRWAKSAIESLDKKANKFLKKEYTEACKSYENNGKTHIEGIDTPEELLIIRKEFLEKWSSSSVYNICEYPYLEELSESKIINAIAQDIVLCVTEILKNEYEFDINKIVIKSPSEISPGLFTPHRRGRKANVLGVTRQGENFSSQAYDTEDINGEQIEVIYEFSIENKINTTEKIDRLKLELVNPETEKKALSKIFLDRQDLDIIRYVYTYSHNNIYNFYVSDLIKYLGISDSKRNYERIEDRLIKLPYYTFYTEKYDDSTKTKKRTSFNLFSMTNIETRPDGRRLAQVTRAFVEEVERASTEIMYKKELNKLTLDQAVNLAYFLEGRRSYEISSGNDVRDKKYNFSIDFLKWYVHLGNKKTLKQNMLYIEEGLKEIIKHQFIIKKYEMRQSSFDIWFYEGIEKRKGLLNNTILSLPEYTDNIIEL